MPVVDAAPGAAGAGAAGASAAGAAATQGGSPTPAAAQAGPGTPAAAQAGPGTPVPPQNVVVGGWGGRDPVRARVVRAGGVADLAEAVAVAGAGGAGLIPRGMGRSYGDAAQRAAGTVVDMTGMADFEVDWDQGILRAQAGVTLGRLLAALAPAGWVLPVVPGTQHVTVGGAVAADIHGKNHGTVGTFGAHVRSLGLMTAGGEVLHLGPDSRPELFAATIGGMGLTGVILWAEITLRPLPSPLLVVDVDRVSTLDDAIGVLQVPGGAHRVAWLDLLGPGLVRGVVTRAAPATGARPEPDGAGTVRRRRDRAARATVDARLRIPAGWPGGLLRPEVVRAYNEFRFRSTPRHALGRLEPFGAHMFPLDALDAWPRLYGRSGFVQYQLVVPRGREADLERVIVRLRSSKVPCYLAVLKDFGPANGFPLSFPLEGWTLALDMPGAAPGLSELMDEFDGIVAAAGGRVYLAKDGRLRPDALRAMYPRLAQWRAARDAADPEHRWASDLAVRTGLV